MRYPTLLLLVCWLASTSCGWWIAVSEVPEVDTDVEGVDTTHTGESDDSSVEEICPQLLSVSGPVSMEGVWKFQRFYLSFDAPVSVLDLALSVAPTGSGLSGESLQRLPGTFQQDRVHIVQTPPSGWSSDAPQTLVIRWGEECSHEVDFVVESQGAQGQAGLSASEPFSVRPSEGRIFPPGLPLQPSDLPTNFLVRSTQDWSGDEAPAAVYLASFDGDEQHPCSPTYLRDPGALLSDDHITVSTRELPYEVAGSLVKLESGLFDITFQGSETTIHRMMLTMPADGVTGLNLCDYTDCRVCPSGNRCALFWVEGLSLAPTDAGFSVAAVACDQDPNGVCDGYCEPSNP